MDQTAQANPVVAAAGIGIMGWVMGIFGLVLLALVIGYGLKWLFSKPKEEKK